MNPKFFPSQSQFHDWLDKNHDKTSELFVGFYKKDSGKKSITYQEALDEALCYGWIDGVRKSLDNISYTIRFTPRKPKSIWSLVNKRRVEELTRLGHMKTSGLKAFELRDPKKTGIYAFENATRAFEPKQEKQFRANKKAWEFFQRQPPGYKRIAIHWVTSAKQEETRQRRLAQLISDSGNETRLGVVLARKKR